MLIQQFLTYLQSERNYSINTTIAYKKDILDLKKFLNNIKLQDATKKDIRKYLAFLVNEKISERSINRKLSSIKSFYNFLLLTETIAKVPTAGIKTLKSYPKVQIPYSKGEMAALLDSSIKDRTDFNQIRNLLVVEMLYQTGMRRSELIHLKKENINFNKNELKVTGKRNKERLIPIQSKLLALIQEYLHIAEIQDVNIDKELFVTKAGKSLYPKLVYKIVNSYLSIVTQKNKKSPHMLRHSFATHFLQNGAEINAVKEILGHASLAATQHYTHNDIEQLKKVFNKTHPRGSK